MNCKNQYMMNACCISVSNLKMSMYKNQCMINSMMQHSFEEICQNLSVKNAGICQLTEVQHMHFRRFCFSVMVSSRYLSIFVNFFIFVLWVRKIIYQNLMLLIFLWQKPSFLNKHNFFYWWETYAMKFRY